MSSASDGRSDQPVGEYLPASAEAVGGISGNESSKRRASYLEKNRVNKMSIL